MTIEVMVDETTIQPWQFEMHYQDDPFPGGHRYTMRITDPEMIDYIKDEIQGCHRNNLPRSEASRLFNLIRIFVSFRYKRRDNTLFWANSIESLSFQSGEVVFSGICSPHQS